MKKVTLDGEIIDEVTHEVIARAPTYWKTPYNFDTDAESKACGTTCLDESKTQQSFAKDADINNILRKFLTTGELPVTGTAEYGEQSDQDLADVIVTKDQVDAAWAAMTPEQRNTFKDPETFVRYIDHALETRDYTDLVKLGLATARKPPEPPPEPAKPAATPEGGTPAPQPPKGAPGAP